MPTASKPLPGNLRSDAVSLEVPVKVHGSRIALGSGANSSTERFEEQTNTMIVFPEGGVLRMTTPVSAGQMLVLTNLKSRQDAICRVVKVRTFPNAPSYVEIEFTRALAAYWGVYFSPRSAAGAKTSAEPPAPQSSPRPPEAAHAAPAAIHDSLPKPISQTSVAPAPVPEPPELRELRLPNPPMPPAPPAPAAVPASQFVLIGSHEEVAVAAESTTSTLPSETMSPLPIPGENRIHTPAPPLTISDLRAPANSSRPEAPSPSSQNASSASTPLTIEPERMSVSLLAESTAAPAASARIRPPVLSGSFGTRLDSPSTGDESLAGESRHNWLLIAAGVVILFGTVAAGAWYLRARVAQNQAVSGTSANPAAAAPQNIQQPAVPPESQSRTAAQSATQTSPVASIPANPAEARRAEPKKIDAAPQSNPVLVGTKDAFGALGEERPPSTAARSSLPASAPKTAEKAPATNLAPAPLNAHPTLKKRAVNLPGQAPAVEQSADPGAAGLLAMGPSKLAVPAPPENHALPTAPGRVGGMVKEPKLISTVMPMYPFAAKEAGVQGDVVIDTQISASGSVARMKVTSGPAMLRQAAMDAVRHWKYQPSELDGKPVAVEMLVTVRFRL